MILVNIVSLVAEIFFYNISINQFSLAQSSFKLPKHENKMIKKKKQKYQEALFLLFAHYEVGKKYMISYQNEILKGNASFVFLT